MILKTSINLSSHSNYWKLFYQRADHNLCKTFPFYRYSNPLSVTFSNRKKHYLRLKQTIIKKNLWSLNNKHPNLYGNVIDFPWGFWAKWRLWFLATHCKWGSILWLHGMISVFCFHISFHLLKIIKALSVELTRLRELQHLVFLCLSYTAKIKYYLRLYAQHWQQY